MGIWWYVPIFLLEPRFKLIFTGVKSHGVYIYAISIPDQNYCRNEIMLHFSARQNYILSMI
jgi:hypothetical protein